MSTPFPRRTARPTSADLHAIVSTMRNLKEGCGVYTKRDSNNTARYCEVNDEEFKGRAKMDSGEITPVGVLTTTPQHSRTAAHRGSKRPSCIVALSGPVSTVVPQRTDGDTGRPLTTDEVEDALLAGGFGCRVMPHHGSHYRRGNIRFQEGHRVNVILFDLLERTNEPGLNGYSRGLSIGGKPNGDAPNSRHEKYRTMMSAHPFDVVCVANANIHEGDVLVRIKEDAGTFKRPNKSHRYSVKTATHLDDPLLIIGVAVSSATGGQSIPVRVGGIVSLNNKMADMLQVCGPIRQVAGVAGEISGTDVVEGERERIIVGEKYCLISTDVSNELNTCSTFQPIEYLKGSVINASVLHGRLGSLSRY